MYIDLVFDNNADLNNDNNEDISNKFIGLSTNTLYDIYNIHNLFLLSNYQFTQYPKTEFLDDIVNNKYFNSSTSFIKQININT